MALFTTAEQRFAAAAARLIYGNPFLPERVDVERQLLGEHYTAPQWSYAMVDEIDHEHANLTRLDERADQLAGKIRQRLLDGVRAGDDEWPLYYSLIVYLLYRRFRTELLVVIARGLAQPGEPPRVPFWKRFEADYRRYIDIPGRQPRDKDTPAYLLAGLFQVRRAFYHIYHYIAGASRPAGRLRAAVWQSIFTHDVPRYFRLNLFEHTARFATLITGPSGTGKELAARAIALSRLIPFEPAKGQFAADFAGSFQALNLSALAATLVESELFGHCKGSFTGAVQDRPGWLETCPATGAVFLDEIGDVDLAIQVKLLRVLQERKFHRLGETRQRSFHGKIIAATHRDLAQAMAAGRFRADFYYRLCADMIETPSLAEQLADCPEDLPNLVRFIIKGIAPEAVEELAGEVETWLASQPRLGRDYAWPGNFRELEQCVWSVLIRKEYRPVHARSGPDPVRELADAICAGRLSADEVESRYCTLLFAQTGSYQETARRLGRNWRTVKSKIDPAMLQRLGVTKFSGG